MTKQKISAAAILAAVLLLCIAAALLFSGPVTVRAESQSILPVIAYDFSDPSNYGKDKMGRQDLKSYKQNATIVKGDRGIRTPDNTFYMPNGRGNKDFSDEWKTFTVSLWFKPSDSGTGRILCTGNYTILDGFVLIYEKREDGTAYIYPDMYSEQGINGTSDGSGHWNCCTQVIGLDEWHKFAVSIDDTAKKVLYLLDDELIGSFNYEGELLMENSFQTFSLFGLTHTAGAGHTDFFGGYIADVRVYDFALNEAQLKAITYGKDLSAEVEGEYLDSVEAVEEQTFHPDVPRDAVLERLPAKLTLTGSDGTEVKSEIEWMGMQQSGSTGTAYGYIVSHELPNIKGLMAEAQLKFEEEEELPLLLSPMFKDGMVLQRGGCKVFGKAGNTQVTVTVTGYDPVQVTCENGDWAAELDLAASADPVTVTVSTGKGESITIENVLIGEVWFASGQSNMDYNVQQMTGETLEKLQQADYSNIRFNKRSMYSSFEAVERYGDSWTVPTGFDSIKDQSAFAACFAVALAQSLEEKEGQPVPVGIVSAAVGGSGIEQWMSKESIESAGSRIDTNAGKYDTEFYYGMSWSVKDYTFRGLLWYQGEDNIYAPELYKKQFNYYLQDMRALFGDEDLPVLVIQLPQYNMIEWAQFRQTQWELSQENENVYTVVGIEYGEINDIHPTKDKYPFAERASGIAMRYIYGDESAPSNSPYPALCYIEGESLIVELSDSEGLHTLYNRKTDGFELQIDGEWVAASPAVINDMLVFTGYEGTPTAVRYFYLANTKDYEAGFNYVYNEDNMPLSPFIFDVGEKQFAVTIDAGEGSVSVGGALSVVKGATVTFSVVPPQGYEIEEIVQNGVPIYFSGTTVTTSAIMKDTQIVVRYREKAAAETFTVTVENDDTKGGVRLSKENVAAGESVSLVFTPAEGFEVDFVTVNGNKLYVQENALVLDAVAADVQISVTYRQAGASGSGASGCGAGVAYPAGMMSFVLFGAVALAVRKRKIK